MIALLMGNGSENCAMGTDTARNRHGYHKHMARLTGKRTRVAVGGDTSLSQLTEATVWDIC